MKLILLAVALFGYALAEEAPYAPSGTKPQGALLVLPSRQVARQYGAPSEATSSQDPQIEASVSLDKLSAIITERLRQEEGVQSGNYYVFRPDGRLQNVQYTSAPLRVSPSQNNQQVNLQNGQSFSNSNTFQFNQQNAQANSRLQGYTQGYPSNRESLQYRQPSSQEAGFAQEAASNQNFKEAAPQLYRQPIASNAFRQPAANQQFAQQSPRFTQPQQVSSQYGLPAVRPEFGFQSERNQLNDEAASNQYTESVPGSQFRKPTETNKPAQNKVQYNQATNAGVGSQPEGSTENETNEPTAPVSQSDVLHQQYLLQQQQQFLQLQQPQGWSASYVANVQFADVQPIVAPIYSYAPAPLVRILRYAPKYE